MFDGKYYDVPQSLGNLIMWFLFHERNLYHTHGRSICLEVTKLMNLHSQQSEPPLLLKASLWEMAASQVKELRKGGKIVPSLFV